MNYEVVSQTRSRLAEGPFWYRGEFYWLDIAGATFRKVDASGTEEAIFTSADNPVTAAVPVNGGGFALACEDGFYHWLRGEVKPLASFRAPDGVRFNDGKCDPQGRFWAGTMDRQESEFCGSLYTLDLSGQVSEKLNGVCISNGLCWHESTFYYIDSMTQAVEAFDYDSESAGIRNRRIVYQLEGEVYPDGMCIDSDGMLWVALWNGYGVIQIDPKSSELLQKIGIPCRKATSCCFGGEQLDELYVTTDSRGENLEKYPLSGHVFKFKTESRGLSVNTYRPMP